MPSFPSRKFFFMAVYVASLFVFASYLLAQDPTPPVATPEVTSIDTASVEFYGTVQIANRIAVLINNQLIDLTSARINAELEPGTLVHVQGVWLEDGTFAAMQVDSAPDGVLPGIVAFSGIVEAFDPQAKTLQMLNQQFSLTSALVHGSITVGDTVSVFAVAVSPSTWSALAVIDLSDNSSAIVPAPVAAAEASSPLVPVTTPDANAAAPAATQEVSDDFEFIGAIEQLGEGFIVVSGLRVDITQARIDDTLAVGLVVRVEAFTVSGQLVAERVRADD